MMLHARMKTFLASMATLSAIMLAAPAMAATVTVVPPNQTVAQIPVTQFKTGSPGTLPSIIGHSAVGTVFAIQSYSSSQATPTSPPPGPGVCLTNGSCPQSPGCVNNPTWPTISQSISWWQSNNQSIQGTYAYTVGSTYSHQDAEGWINHCSYTPQPQCSTGAGWTGAYHWSYPNWISGCNYQPPPSCPRSAGWSGSYRWNGSFWYSGCVYTTQPPCPTGAGWTGSYYWTGSTWASGCSYRPRPNCPTHYSGGYYWTGSTWAGGCTPNRCPTGAGWTGSYYPSCNHQGQPSCPSGYSGSYSWNGSSWVDNCHAPAPPPPPPSGVYAITIWTGTVGFGGHDGTAPHYMTVYTTLTKAEFNCAAAVITPAKRVCRWAGRRYVCNIDPAHNIYRSGNLSANRSSLINSFTQLKSVYSGMPFLYGGPEIFPAQCGNPPSFSYAG